jgi:hypothetical protein
VYRWDKFQREKFSVCEEKWRAYSSLEWE